LLITPVLSGGKVDDDDNHNLRNLFGTRLGQYGKYGWGAFVKSAVAANNYFTADNADGTTRGVAWGVVFPRIVVADFTSNTPNDNKLIRRTSYMFFGASSILYQLDLSDAWSSDTGLFFWNEVDSDVTIGGVNLKNVTYTKRYTINNQDVNLRIEFLIFKQGGSFSYLGNTITGKTGDVKSTYTVVGWPFTGTDKQLHLGVYINSKGKGAPNHVSQTDGAAFTVGDGKLTTATTSLNDNVETPCNVTRVLDGDGNSDDETRGLWIFSFDKFDNSLVYDPTNSLTGGASAITVAYSMIVLIMIVVAFMM